MGDRYFLSRCLLSFLLKTVDQHDPAPSKQEIHEAVNVCLALPAQFPEFALQVPYQRLPSLHVSHPQLVESPAMF